MLVINSSKGISTQGTANTQSKSVFDKLYVSKYVSGTVGMLYGQKLFLTWDYEYFGRKRRNRLNTSETIIQCFQVKLDNVPKRAKTWVIKKHLWNILNTGIIEISYGTVKAPCNQKQNIQIHGRHYRNKEYFTNITYFYFGGLNLYPCGAGQ